MLATGDRVHQQTRLAVSAAQQQAALTHCKAEMMCNACDHCGVAFLTFTLPLLPQDTALLEYERRVSAMKSAARMQRTLQRKEQVLEERRASILAAEAAAEFRMQQKEEVSKLTKYC